MSIDPTRRAEAEGDADVSPDEAMAQLGRILDSETFSKALVLRRFLQFLVERTLQGRTDEIKEYALGVDVFDRGSDFDPRTDTIVRVQARRLRAKLEEYSQGSGGATGSSSSFRRGPTLSPSDPCRPFRHVSPSQGARSCHSRENRLRRCRARFPCRRRVLR